MADVIRLPLARTATPSWGGRGGRRIRDPG